MSMSPTKSKSKVGLHKPGRKERLGSKDTELAAPVEQTHQMVIMTIYIMVRCRADEVIIYPHRNLSSNFAFKEDTKHEVKEDADHVVAKVVGGTSQPRQGADSTLLITLNCQKLS